MQKFLHSSDGKVYGVVILGAIISCFIALYNNYPLVYPDTGSYLHSGWENVVFYDRTIFYGLFLFEASYGGSPFLMVFAQGLIISYLLFATLNMFFDGIERRVIFLSLIIFLTLFTGYSYTVSILIPDIFSAITILCLINLLINYKIGWFQYIVISLIYLYSICTQFSSIPILSLVFAAIFIFLLIAKIRKRQVIVSFKRFFITLGLSLSTLLIIPSVHYYYDGYFKISGSNHVFVMNHLLETGVLEDYLNTACNSKDYKICQYKDSLGWDFIWSENSPVHKTGGWEANRKEYKAIIKDVLSQEKYFWKLFRKGYEYSFKQLFTFQTTVSPPQLDFTAPYGQIQWRLPDTRREYISALQNTGKLNTAFVNTAELIVILPCMMVLFLLAFSPFLLSKLSSQARWMSLLVLLYTISSAIMCSNLSTVHARFLNRIVWLIPVCVIIILIEYLKNKKSEERLAKRGVD